MQENTELSPQNESPTMPINTPVPERMNAFRYPEQQKAPTQYNLAPRKTNPLMLALLIIIFLLGLAIILWKFVFGSNVDFLNAFRAVSSPTPTVVVVPTAIPTVDPTANWKTYKNEKYGFELDNVENWTISEKDNFVNFQNKNDIVVDFTISCYKEDIDIQKYAASSPVKDTVINNIIAKKIEYLNPDNRKQIYLSINGKSVNLLFSYTESNDSEVNREFDKILSTFKFTAANNISVTPIATGSSQNK